MKLDQRITHRRGTLSADGQGGHTESVATVRILRANIKIVGGRENVSGDRITAVATYVFTFRNNSYTRAILTSDRLQWQGVDFNVKKIDDLGERPLYLAFTCERGVAQ